MKYLVMDGSYQTFRHIFSSIKDETFNPKYVAYRVFRTIIKELNSYDSYPIICFDKHGSKYRKSIYKDYKGNRYSDTKDEIRFDDNSPDELRGKVLSDFSIPIDILISYFNIIKLIENDDKEFKEFQSALEDAVRMRTYLFVRDLFTNELPKIGILTLTISGYEADDIGYFFSNCIEGSGRLLSDDKDWYISITDNYDLYRPMSEKLVTINDVSNDYKELVDRVSPSEAVRLFKAIIGDGSDNIPGFDGIGGVRGYNILNNIVTSNGINICNILNEDNKLHYLIKNINNLDNLGTIGKSIIDSMRSKYINNSNELINVDEDMYNWYMDNDYRLPVFKKSLINNLDRFELNYKLVGFDHLKEENNKNELFSLIMNKIDILKPLTQLSYLQFCSLLDSETLPSNYNDLSRIDINQIKSIKLK